MMFVTPRSDPFIVFSAETVLHREPGYGCKYLISFNYLFMTVFVFSNVVNSVLAQVL